MKTTAFKYCSLIIGLIAAVIIVISQSHSFEEPLKAKIKTEEAANTSAADEENPGEATISISATGFPAAAQINFFQDAFCLFELVYSDDSSMPPVHGDDIPADKFFRTILRVIISPNAP